MSALTLAAELIRIDSVNPGLVPGAAGESAIADYLRARLVRTGFDTHLVDAAAGWPSLRRRGAGSRRSTNGDPQRAPGHGRRRGGCARRSHPPWRATGCPGAGRGCFGQMSGGAELAIPDSAGFPT